LPNTSSQLMKMFSARAINAITISGLVWFTLAL
jgi:hypothetical protein